MHHVLVAWKMRGKRALIPVLRPFRKRAAASSSARRPSQPPRHRDGVSLQQQPSLRRALGLAAASGFPLGVALACITLALVGPSWLVALSMLVGGVLLAAFVAKRAHTPYSTVTVPPFAQPETR
ncbi:MAG TPA: hypothetical protein VM925_16830 [Labilithrix sp.]|nr:hypothetical protein [Labilithrix sp.]